MPSGSVVRAWSPPIPGIAEVLHAHFTDHIYPMHTHTTWTLLVIDDGAVRYDLGHHEYAAFRQVVTLLPPHVPHNGCPASPQGFRKRVLYLDSSQLSERLIGLAVDRPAFDDVALRTRIERLHTLLLKPGCELQAEIQLAFIAEHLHHRLWRRVPPRPSTGRDPRLAAQLRDLLDERFVEGVTLRQASQILYADRTYLVRAFSREYGMGPHQYVVSRRVDLARRLLLDGVPPHEVAAKVGFYDQSHLNRHFKRLLGVTPGRYGHPAGIPGPAGSRVPQRANDR